MDPGGPTSLHPQLVGCDYETRSTSALIQICVLARSQILGSEYACGFTALCHQNAPRTLTDREQLLGRHRKTDFSVWNETISFLSVERGLGGR